MDTRTDPIALADVRETADDLVSRHPVELALDMVLYYLGEGHVFPDHGSPGTVCSLPRYEDARDAWTAALDLDPDWVHELVTQELLDSRLLRYGEVDAWSDTPRHGYLWATAPHGVFYFFIQASGYYLDRVLAWKTRFVWVEPDEEPSPTGSFTSKVTSRGGGFGLYMPASVARELGIVEGDEVDVGRVRKCDTNV